MAETQLAPRQTAADIAEILIAEIRKGVIEVDSPMPTERELCERFGLSRPTVREAMMTLQLRGFISAGSGKRPRAVTPSVGKILSGAGEHLKDILGDAETGAYLEQMRQFIETGAAREAARHANGVQIAKLRVALEQNREAIGTEEFGATDIAFHQALVAVVGNPVILTLHSMFVSEVLKLRPKDGDRTAADANTFEEHRAVFQAILDANASQATELLDQHLERSYRKRLAMGQDG
ncbi:MAG: FCD domain-containing protein [Pelagimonas sp.]